MDIAIYTLTSELHDENAVSAVTQALLGSLGISYTFKGSDYADYGSHTLSVIYVRTGGTEGIFKRLLPQLRQQTQAPFYLLTSGKSNSLAASMEILSYLQQNYMREAKNKLFGTRYGIIGQPSDWLISSAADPKAVKTKLGINLVEVPIEELIEGVGKIEEGEMPDRIYEGLKMIVDKYQLQGFTLRCFDLLTAVHNTGCLALARLNAEGIVAGCEGDVPAMLSMAITNALLGVSGFQANPSQINPETGEMLFAHCTIPLNMVERYELDTHFESGIGVGIRGFMKEGPVTVFKVSGDLKRCFMAEGELIRNQAKPDLCRTQQVIQLADSCQTGYFLTQPIGNHHIITPGNNRKLFEDFIASL